VLHPVISKKLETIAKVVKRVEIGALRVANIREGVKNWLIRYTQRSV
jgi:predicted transcriptional regulator